MSSGNEDGSSGDNSPPVTALLSAKEQEVQQKKYAEDNDRRIGWPDPLTLWTCGNNPASEYPLRLSGFKRNSRDEIMGALLTLTKHGISLDHLIAGHAEGKELPVERDCKKIYYRELEKGSRRETTNREVPTITMLRVGHNFVDFEMAMAEKNDFPAHLFTTDGNINGELWPRQRVREMHTPESITDARDAPMVGGENSGNQLDKYCTYRVFAGDYKDYEDERLKGSWHSVRKTVDRIESFMHLKWWKNRPHARE